MWYNGSQCTANQMEVDVVATETHSEEAEGKKSAVNKFNK